ncbi:hypothetical protein BDN71DRAFT_1453608 [Pleurotus eryngii]|uniref:DUF7704 domain-containing protein n=1 Tax=Pleurotus eryngii TaxID=5323 RepID=A0A9P6D3C0_PLEER|nr:hypothetical protein BDN71DRAFT_1453608 [Pleurotus eryngii]
MRTPSRIPAFYRLFFIYVEPLSAIAGALYAALVPEHYLADLALTPVQRRSAEVREPLGVAQMMSLWQLANLYLLFALNEHLVLSSTSSIATWRRLLCCLLIADFGHLITMSPLGLQAFWHVWEWNAMLWGSIGFVYVGASMRMSFLLGVGLGGRLGGKRK